MSNKTAIAARELRVNNLIRFAENAETCIVKEIMLDGLRVYFPKSKEEVWIEIDQFEPIELTPEILEKAGGKNRGGWVGYFYEAEVYGEDVRVVWQLIGGRLSIFVNDNLIRYEESPTVHYFQNSVYFLTGEELPLTL